MPSSPKPHSAAQVHEPTQDARWIAHFALAALAALACMVTAACTSDEAWRDELRSLTLQEQTLWQSTRPQSYSFEYEELGFTFIRGVWQVDVDGDAVTGVSGGACPYQECEPLSVATAPTIDQLFQPLLNTVDSPDTSASVSFDFNLHYSTYAYLGSGGPGVAWEYWGYTVALLPPP